MEWLLAIVKDCQKKLRRETSIKFSQLRSWIQGTRLLSSWDVQFSLEQDTYYA